MELPHSHANGGPATRNRKAPSRRRRILKYVGGFGILLILLLVAARIALPSYLQSYVNRVLDQSPAYDGRVGTVSIHLYRGAYSIENVEIVITTNAVPIPFFQADRLDFSLDWRSLLHGRTRATIRMDKPRLHFVHGATPEETQTGAGQPWLSIFDDLSPFRIDKAEVIDGEIHFHAFHKKPEVNVYLSDVQAEVRNLTNIEDKTDPLIATVHATGRAMESGDFQFDMSLDPQAHYPTFNLALRLLNLDVTRLNSLARAYGEFDFEGGHFDLTLETTTKDGFLQGEAKPLFRNVTVLGLRDIAKDNPLQFLWESLVGVVGAVFKNQARDQFGTSITLQGDLENPNTSILEIVGNVLRNAFVRAYLPRLEGRIAPDVVNAQGSVRYDPQEPKKNDRKSPLPADTPNPR